MSLQTAVSAALAHKSEGRFHLGHGPFYHLLKTPSGAVSHVTPVDTANLLSYDQWTVFTATVQPEIKLTVQPLNVQPGM